MTQRVLLIDDDSDQCDLMQSMLERLGYRVESTTSPTEGLSKASAPGSDYCAILTDLAMHEMSGLELCEKLLAAAPGTPVVVVTGDTTTEAAIAALRSGAFDYVTKPLDPQLLGLSLARAAHRSHLLSELERLKRGTAAADLSAVGESSAMRRMQEMITRVARSDASVLIQGETGSGKELAARAIHQGSSRANGPFIAINCAAVPATLLESELFGHAKGAFTDAKQQRGGLFLEASGGTLFLDEIGDMPLEMQSKLLRALQQRCVRPVGSNAEVPFDARILTATHRDLEAEVKAGRFRQDLFYRINVVSVNVPPLRERDGDILRLADHFLERFCREGQRPKVRLSPQVAERLISHDWPGNVRELENCMERLAALSRYDVTVCQDLPDTLFAAGQAGALPGTPMPDDIINLAELERRHIFQVLERVKGNKSRAAQLLGFDRRTLYRKLDGYERGEPGAAALSDLNDGGGEEPATAGV